jgi:hypothetical protein
MGFLERSQKIPKAVQYIEKVPGLVSTAEGPSDGIKKEFKK